MTIKNTIAALILFSQLSYAQSADLSAKRAELTSHYSAALDRIWQISETVPVDYYLSSLGVSLLSIQTNDPKINAKLNMAGANLLYLATITSLNLAESFLKKQQVCNTAFEKYKKILEPPHNLNPDGTCTLGNPIETSVCMSRVSDCQTSLREYFVRFDSMIQNQKNFPIYPEKDNGTSFASLSAPFFLESYLISIKDKCSNSGFKWAKGVGQELESACLPVAEGIYKDHLLRDEIFEETKKRTELKHHACKQTQINYNKIPPIMYHNYGENFRYTNCVDPLFLGIDIHKPTALKQSHMFLISNERRAFYWQQMAEEAYHRVKSNETFPKDDLNKEKYQISKPLKLTTVSKCVSPILDKQHCSNFSQKFDEALIGRENLFFLSEYLLDIKRLGDNFNTKKEITQTDLLFIERLSQNLDRNKKKIDSLIRQVQDQIYKTKFSFDFKKELEKL